MKQEGTRVSHDPAETAHRACERLFLKIAHLTDHGPQAEIAALFTEDGEVDRDGTLVRGRDALREMYAKRPANLMTRHLVSNLWVEPGTAGDWVCRALATVYRIRGTEGTRPVPPVHCEGPESIVEYEDHVSCEDGLWRVRRRVMRTVIHLQRT